MDEAPFSQHFASVSEYRQALDRVIEQARHRVYLFDYDLQDGAWNSPQREALLKQFILRSTDNRLHMALHSVDHLRRNCPRLLNLQHQYSYAVFIHETLPEARSINDPMLIADGQHYVHRFHYQQARGELVLHDPDQTLRLARLFDEIWHASSVAVTATTLGL